MNGVYYVDVEHGWAVVPSNAGRRREPAWWLNLQARPDATLRVGRREHTIPARRATGAEQPRLWAWLEAANPAYREYRAVAGRPIPIVIIERVGS